MKILTITDKKEEKFLRTKVADFDLKKADRSRLNKIIKEMRETMIRAKGVGLSANQVGLNLRFFIAQIPENDISINQPNHHKSALYIIFNPKIKTPLLRNKKTKMEEGCLSVPGIYGLVERPEKIVLTAQDINGKKIKIKADGLLARVFQHETDHLNGILFIDKCDKMYAINTKFQNPNSK